MNDESSSRGGVDLAGLGKVAEAIPEEVYTRTADTTLRTFEGLLAPLVETTAGVGRYLRQKFDNLVEVEKAMAVFALEKAWTKAAKRAHAGNTKIGPIVNIKSFVKALEEVSKETDEFMHEWWVNLLASEIAGNGGHPHLVELMPHLSRSEADILLALRDRNDVGAHHGAYLVTLWDRFEKWTVAVDATEIRAWEPSCVLLCQLGLADVVMMPDTTQFEVAVLYRTWWGRLLLEAVSDPGS